MSYFLLQKAPSGSTVKTVDRANGKPVRKKYRQDNQMEADTLVYGNLDWGYVMARVRSKWRHILKVEKR